MEVAQAMKGQARLTAHDGIAEALAQWTDASAQAHARHAAARGEQRIDPLSAPSRATPRIRDRPGAAGEDQS